MCLVFASSLIAFVATWSFSAEFIAVSAQQQQGGYCPTWCGWVACATLQQQQQQQGYSDPCSAFYYPQQQQSNGAAQAQPPAQPSPAAYYYYYWPSAYAYSSASSSSSKNAESGSTYKSYDEWVRAYNEYYAKQQQRKQYEALLESYRADNKIGFSGHAMQYPGYTNLPLECHKASDCWAFADYPNCVWSAHHGHHVCCSTQLC